jgi:hypothetical protein
MPMRMPRVGWIVFAAILAGCGDSDAPMPVFTTKFGGFSVEMPETPKEQDQNITVGKEKIPIKMYVIDKGSSGYIVAVHMIVGFHPYACQPEAVYDVMQGGALASTKATLVEKHEVTQAGLPAREYLATAPDGKTYLRVRYVYVAPWVYQIQSIGSRSTVESKRSTRFLDSFKPLPEGADAKLATDPKWLKRPGTTDVAEAKAPKAPTPPADDSKEDAVARPRTWRAVAAAPPAPADIRSPGDLAVTPTEPGGSLKGGSRRVDDLDVTDINLGKDQLLLPCVQLSADGKSVLVLSKTGTLRKVALDGLAEERRLEVGRECSWLSTSAKGPLLTVSKLEEVWLLDPETLAVVRKIPSKGASRAVSSPGLDRAFVVQRSASAGSGADRLEVLDLDAGRPVGVYTTKQFERAVEFNLPVVSTDAAYLFTVGTTGQIIRFRIGSDSLQIEDMGPGIGSGAQAMVVSPGGEYVAVTSRAGNQKPDDKHPALKYGTYLYKPTELAKPIAAIESGAFPRAIGFDAKAGSIYAQNDERDLITFGSDGDKLKEYRLRKGKGAENHDTIQILDLPEDRGVLVVAKDVLMLAGPSKGGAVADDPAKDATAKKKSTTAPKKKMTTPTRPPMKGRTPR